MASRWKVHRGVVSFLSFVRSDSRLMLLKFLVVTASNCGVRA